MSVPWARLIALITILFAAAAAFAQQIGQFPPSTPPAVDCPPGINGDPPTIGGGRSAQPLGEKLAESKPPAGIDPVEAARRHRSRNAKNPSRRG
jgi:hypothetical protein